jgi:hypothetical protein
MTVQRKPRGKRFGVERTISNVSIHDFDVLLIPGGYFPDRIHFRKEEERQFVQEFIDSGKALLGTGCRGSKSGQSLG